MNKRSVIRRLWAGLYDLAMVAGMGFVLMFPFGAFEGEEAYYFWQIVLRVIGLIIAGFVVLNGVNLVRGKPTWGQRFAGSSTAADSGDAKRGFFGLLGRLLLIILLSASPFIAIVAEMILGRLANF